MKIAISGKGGVGKTTLTALLARTLAGEGRSVTVIDADPATNLASALGLPRAEWPEAISGLKDMIRERTGVKTGYGDFFKLNPDVDDLPGKHSKTINGVRVMVLGGVPTGGSGCFCPESALLKALVTHMLLKQDEVVIMDMEAGIEHLGRATVEAVTMMIIVAEPGQRSVHTAQTIRKLAEDINIPRIGLVFNKVPPGTDLKPLEGLLVGLPLLGTLSLDPVVARAELEGGTPWTGLEPQKSEVRTILDKIISLAGTSE